MRCIRKYQQTNQFCICARTTNKKATFKSKFLETFQCRFFQFLLDIQQNRLGVCTLQIEDYKRHKILWLFVNKSFLAVKNF